MISHKIKLHNMTILAAPDIWPKIEEHFSSFSI